MQTSLHVIDYFCVYLAKLVSGLSMIKLSSSAHSLLAIMMVGWITDYNPVNHSVGCK